MLVGDQNSDWRAVSKKKVGPGFIDAAKGNFTTKAPRHKETDIFFVDTIYRIIYPRISRITRNQKFQALNPKF
jgi:hypothetical protein